MIKLASLFCELDKIFAIVGCFVSLLLILFGVVHIEKIMSLIIGILILIPCLLWLVIRKDDLKLIYFTTSRLGVKIWAIVFFVLLTLDMLTIYLRPNLYERPILFFIITALMAGAVACECISAERQHSGFILIQIILLGVILGGSQTLIFPGLNGFDDWYHLNIINNIVDEHYIPLGFSYSDFPVLHIVCAISFLITALPLKFGNVVVIDFGQIICSAVFIFLISDKLFKNHQLGLLSAFIVSIANLQIRFSYLTYPNAFSMIFTLIILYLIFNKIKDTSRSGFYFLLLLLFVTLILTHTITAIFTAILLFSFWFVLLVYQKIHQQSTYNISLLVSIIFCTVMFSWWAFASKNLTQFAQLLSNGIDPEVMTAQAVQTNSLNNIADIYNLNNIANIIFTTFPFYLLLALALIGILYMISRKGNELTYTYALLSIIPVGISFIFYFTGGTAIIVRWSFFAEILLSIPLALVIFRIGTSMANRSIFQYLSFLVLIIVLSSLMITSDTGNHDNKSFPPSSKINLYHTQSELAGYDFFVKYFAGTLSIDTYSFPVMEYFYQWYKYQLLDPSYISGEFKHDGSIKIFRYSTIQSYQRMGILSTNIHPDIDTYMVNFDFNKIYQNDGLVGYS